MNKVYEHGECTMFADVIVGDGETFYCHCAKHHVLRIAKETLKELGCGVEFWTMKGFEHRNKQSKHVCDSKTNGKVIVVDKH